MSELSFWTGVVEDRNDPEQLGRCRVRIFGLHTSDTSDLPTEDLPWAMPLQSVTSAAISGVGSTPVGIVPGTWVMGFFLDGESAQKPIIMGTIAGKTAESPLAKRSKEQEVIEENPYTLKDSNGNVVRDGSGQPIQTTNFDDPLEGFGTLPRGDVIKFVDALGKRFSSNDYYKEENGKLGKYQFSIVQLIMLGYLYRPKESTGELDEILDPAILEDPNNWSGKNAVFSKQEFLDKFSIQENAMIEMMTYNYKNLVRLNKINSNSEPGTVAGLLATSHLAGYINADKLGRKTGNQVLRDIFILGAESVSGQNSDYYQSLQEKSSYLPTPIEDEGYGLNSSEFNNLQGFQDPNKQFPKSEYQGLGDLNKLAVGDDSHRLFTVKENKKITEIPKARTTDTWDEPPPVFGAQYPYNQVIETEAGHVIELDSTPGAERIHMFHKSGTYIEIDVNGSMVRKVTGDNYEVIDNNNYVFVKGAETLTIEGKTRILVKDQAFLEVEGGLSVTSGKDLVIQTARQMALIANKFELSSAEGIDLISQGPVNIQGSSVNTTATDGSIVNAATKSIFNTAGEQFNNISGTETRLEAGKQFDIKSGTNTNLDAGGQFNIRMGQAQKPTAGRSLNLTPKRVPPESLVQSNEPDDLPRDNKGQTSYVGDDDPEGTGPAWIEKEIAKDRMSTTIAERLTGEGTTFGRSNTEPVSVANCSSFSKLKVFSKALLISEKYKYKLGDFITGGWTLQPQSGLPTSKIVCNLSNLARNILEPIRDKYPSVRITSGYRNLTKQFPNENSDHLRGCAVDLQFSTSIKEYRDIAVWIQQNIPYKQLLLEYEADSKGRITKAWIHISLEISDSGRVIPTGGTDVGTIINHTLKYPNQLVNLA